MICIYCWNGEDGHLLFPAWISQYPFPFLPNEGRINYLANLEAETAKQAKPLPFSFGDISVSDPISVTG